MNNGLLMAVCEHLGLSELSPAAVTALDGGRQHQTWRVDTDLQSIVVKKLSTQCFLGEQDAKHIEKTEWLASAIKKHFSFALSAIEKEGQFVFSHDKQHYLFYPYLAGAFDNNPSIDQCVTVGSQLADIHGLNLKESYFQPQGAISFDINAWEGGLRKLLDIEYFNAWFDNFTALADACQKSMQSTNYPLILSHRDINRQNILWQENEATFIDWESAGLINPAVELLGVALNLAGAESGELSMARVNATLAGYRHVHGALPLLDETLYTQAYLTWFAWLDYCLADKNSCLDDAELLQEVQWSLNVISLMQSYQPVLLACFNPSLQQTSAPVYICANQ